MKTKNITKHVKKAKISFTFDSVEAMNKFYEVVDSYAKQAMSEVKDVNAKVTVYRHVDKCKIVVVSRGVELNKVFL